MRIVIDLQAAQAENRFRGIGRLALSLTQEMARQRGEHEIIIALNGTFPDAIPAIREAFRGLLPSDAIRVWSGLEQTAAVDPSNQFRRDAGALIREAFLQSLNPSILLVSSLFEGFVDGAVTSIKKLPQSYPTALILYDLIPLIYRDHYLQNESYAAWYLQQFEELKKADLLLCISDSSRQEAIEWAGFAEEALATIYAGKESHFTPCELSEERKTQLLEQFGLRPPFVLYGGGIDFRKNIEGLIRAFALLPSKIRKQHQLAIVCSVPPPEKERLETYARNQGLKPGQFVMTGYVSEEDLVDIYRLAKVFVFPSLHEGFGLPALEAMACGIPVIGANCSSLPEVIGREDALFDPKSDDAISHKLEEVLTNPLLSASLRAHGLEQASRFSWEKSARLALESLEMQIKGMEASEKSAYPKRLKRRPKLAYLSPLQPARSGIADYSSELLGPLSVLYDIDVIVDQDEVTDPWVITQGEVRNIRWFKLHYETYDRVLYHFGNSAFHSHMFDLLPDFPGVIVLHDFFLSGILSHRSFHEGAKGSWSNALYLSHGYPALRDWVKGDMTDRIWRYPASLEVLQNALGIIVHSKNSLRLMAEWFGGHGEKCTLIPHLRSRAVLESDAKLKARKQLGFKPQDLLVCSFGLLGPSKLNHRLINAWTKSSLAQRSDCYLVFVGQNQEGEYGEEILELIHRLPIKDSVRITGWADQELYKDYLTAADIAVQLRTLSRGETSGTVLDAMNYGLALVVNANGSMADVNQKAVFMLPDAFSDQELVHALEELADKESLRTKLAEEGQHTIHHAHDPDECARRYHQAMEGFYQGERNLSWTLANLIPRIDNGTCTAADMVSIAHSLASSFPPTPRHPQLLVDISELVQRDAKTGIQRVVRSILQEWLQRSPRGYRIEPIYASEEHGYRYARQFTLNFIEGPVSEFLDEPIDFYPGDIFLGLDLQPTIVKCHKDFFQELRNAGVMTTFVVYDLLCVRLPHTFPEGSDTYFTGWLKVVAEADRVVCISKSVAEDFTLWINENYPDRKINPKVSWFRLGSDIENSAPSQGMPSNAKDTLSRIKKSRSFLMVGTLEPRKAHTQALDACERLWNDGMDITLVIVGKQGWMVEPLVERLRNHAERGKRLFWLEGISDEYLDQVMKSSTCLLAPSLGEGFGLPLVEAAKYGLPIIARDIPVFKEVAGDGAFYFEGAGDIDLAECLKVWLDNHQKSMTKDGPSIPSSTGIQTVTWGESADHLLNAVMEA